MSNQEIDLGKIVESLDFKTIEKTMKTITEEVKSDIGNKLNLFIIGKSGVGKSTLINTVFEKDVAKTGSGKPVTQEIESYTKDNLTIYDTKGLELKGNEIEEIKKFLDNQKQKNVEDQIHIVWFCISESGRRIEDVEIELYNVCKELDIPTMIVITKATQDKVNGEKFSDKIKDTFKIDDNFMQRIVAIETEDDDGNTIKPKNINNLINKTYSILPEAQKKAFARKQKYDKDIRKKQLKEDTELLVGRYSKAAAVVAATPMPFSDFALLLPTQIAMIIHISKTYDLELNMEDAKKIAIGLCSVCAAGYGLKLAVGGLLKIIPAIGTVAGAAFNSTVAFTGTKIMGTVYGAYLDDNFDNILDKCFNFEDVADTIKLKYNESDIENIKNQISTTDK
ncbi:50S ribosome-binding GTPase [Campylobacter volucris]|uniref:YcjF family protein n=1 Tax=Campylobacter volucris TaxID=1031542 RepID=UPI00189C829A|nr:GTPase [Campylobacter volucris]MBF7045888.1 50S ribosome-binding GTPase [Campylobacter volucris]